MVEGATGYWTNLRLTSKDSLQYSNAWSITSTLAHCEPKTLAVPCMKIEDGIVDFGKCYSANIPVTGSSYHGVVVEIRESGSLGFTSMIIRHLIINLTWQPEADSITSPLLNEPCDCDRIWLFVALIHNSLSLSGLCSNNTAYMRVSYRLYP